MAKGTKRKIALEPKIKKRWLLFSVAAVIVICLAIQKMPESTVFLKTEAYNVNANAKIYVFKKQEYIFINSTVPLNYLVSEGTDIAASTVIADNYYITSNQYLQQKIAALQYMIDHPQVDTKWEIYLAISELNDQVDSLDAQIDTAVANGDNEGKTNMLNQRTAILDQIAVLENAMRFVFTDLTVMNTMKNTLNSQLNSTTIPLILDNLNFTVTGYIYFSKNGYEDTLNMNVLDNLYDGYFDYLDHYSPNTALADGQYILKSEATDRAVIAVRIGSDAQISDKEDVINYKNELTTAYNMDKEGGYYEFLFRRIDILNQFPNMTAYVSDGTEITGKIVDIVSEGDEQVVMLAVRNNITYFSDKTILSGKLETDSFSTYSVPKSSIVTTDSGAYITVISNTSVGKETIPVTVYQYAGSRALLKVSENPALSEGSQILKHGQKPKNESQDTDTETSKEGQ